MMSVVRPGGINSLSLGYLALIRYDALDACMLFEPKSTLLAEGRRNDEFCLSTETFTT